jgi:hypothetical protein
LCTTVENYSDNFGDFCLVSKKRPGYPMEGTSFGSGKNLWVTRRSPQENREEGPYALVRSSPESKPCFVMKTRYGVGAAPDFAFDFLLA